MDTDSLYDVSVTPPQSPSFRPRHMDHSNQRELGIATSGTLGTRQTKPVGDIRNFVQTAKTRSFAAPEAKMVATPPRAQSSTTLKAPAALRNNKGKGRAVEPSPPVLRSDIRRGKETTDYQAEADAIELRRDRADPDFRATQDQPVTPRERPRKSPKQSSSTTERGKPLRQRNRLYLMCSEGTRTTRDEYIARIRENWGVSPERWIQGSMAPSTTKKIKGKSAARRPLHNPQDWNTKILDKLAIFSSLTQHRQDDAYRALREAVSDKDRGGGGPELLPQDVQRAMSRVASRSVVPTAQNATPPREPMNNGAGISAEQRPQETTADMNVEEPLPQLPQLPSPRSPTIGRGPTIKQEFRPENSIGVASSGGGAWNGLDVELEKYTEQDLLCQLKEAQYARFLQKRRLQEAVRQHGTNRQDAIMITAEGGDE